MKYSKLIIDLQAQLARVEEAISRLEDLRKAPPVLKRRGRKSMGEEERREVSARMKAYWEGWRKGKD